MIYASEEETAKATEPPTTKRVMGPIWNTMWGVFWGMWMFAITFGIFYEAFNQLTK